MSRSAVMKKMIFVVFLAFFMMIPSVNSKLILCTYSAHDDSSDNDNSIYYDHSLLKMNFNNLDGDPYVFLLSGSPINTATQTDEVDNDMGVENEVDIEYRNSNVRKAFNEKKVCPEHIFTNTNWEGFDGHSFEFSNSDVEANEEKMYDLEYSFVEDELMSSKELIALYETKEDDFNSYLQEKYEAVVMQGGEVPSISQEYELLISEFSEFRDEFTADELSYEDLLKLNIYKSNGYYNTANEIIRRYNPESGSCHLLSTEQCNELYNLANESLEIFNLNSNSSIEIIEDVKSCDDIIGDPNEEGSFAYYLVEILDFAKFLAPVFVIALTVFDYIKAICMNDNDIMKKTNKRLVKRLLYMVLLFVIPIIIKVVLNLFLFESHGCGIF